MTNSLADAITLVSLFLTGVSLLVVIGSLPFMWWYQRVTAHHTHRIREMHAGRPDPGPRTPPPDFIEYITRSIRDTRQNDEHWRTPMIRIPPPPDRDRMESS